MNITTVLVIILTTSNLLGFLVVLGTAWLIWRKAQDIERNTADATTVAMEIRDYKRVQVEVWQKAMKEHERRFGGDGGGDDIPPPPPPLPPPPSTED